MVILNRVNEILQGLRELCDQTSYIDSVTWGPRGVAIFDSYTQTLHSQEIVDYIQRYWIVFQMLYQLGASEIWRGKANEWILLDDLFVEHELKKLG